MLFDSASTAKPSAIRISVNSDSITEILGYFHQQLSKHTSELANMQTQMSKMAFGKPAQMEDMQIFLDTSNSRFESFAASIQSLTQQLLHLEDSYQREIENRMAKVYSHVDERLDELSKRIDELENKQPDTIDIEGLIDSKLGERKSPDTIKGKRGKRKKTPVARRVQLSQAVQCEIQTPTQDISQFQNTLAQLRRSCMEIKSSQSTDFERMRAELAANMEKLRTNDEQIVDELNKVHARIDECVTKAELSAMFVKDERRVTMPIGTTKATQKKVHITLINGDSLRRPGQRQTRRFKAP